MSPILKARKIEKVNDDLNLAVPNENHDLQIALSPNSTPIDPGSAIPQPAHPGQLVSSLETPCLLLDLDAFDRNCRMMNEVISES